MDIDTLIDNASMVTYDTNALWVEEWYSNDVLSDKSVDLDGLESWLGEQSVRLKSYYKYLAISLLLFVFSRLGATTSISFFGFSMSDADGISVVAFLAYNVILIRGSYIETGMARPLALAIEVRRWQTPPYLWSVDGMKRLSLGVFAMSTREKRFLGFGRTGEKYREIELIDKLEFYFSLIFIPVYFFSVADFLASHWNEGNYVPFFTLFAVVAISHGGVIKYIRLREKNISKPHPCAVRFLKKYREENSPEKFNQMLSNVDRSLSMFREVSQVSRLPLLENKS